MHNKKILAIIPARAGSKRVKKKNFKPFAGTTLVDLAINQALESKKIDKIIVSSDSNDVEKISLNYKGVSFIERPAELATNESPALEYMLHALGILENQNQFYDLVVIIQPSSPLRTGYDIDKTIELLENNYDADSSVSIVKINHMVHPHKIKKFKNNILFPWLVDEGQKTAAAEIPELYVRNCAVYVFKTTNLKNNITYGKRCLGYSMKPETSVDINNIIDFEFAEFIYNNKSI